MFYFGREGKIVDVALISLRLIRVGSDYRVFDDLKDMTPEKWYSNEYRFPKLKSRIQSRGNTNKKA